MRQTNSFCQGQRQRKRFLQATRTQEIRTTTGSTGGATGGNGAGTGGSVSGGGGSGGDISGGSYDGGVYNSDPVSLGGDGGSTADASVPRVIVTGFDTEPAEVKAGDDFKLIVHLKIHQRKQQ